MIIFVIVFIIHSEKDINSKTLQQIFCVHKLCFYCLLQKPDYISQHPLHINVALWPSSDQRIFFEVDVQHLQGRPRKQLTQIISITSLPLTASQRQTTHHNWEDGKEKHERSLNAWTTKSKAMQRMKISTLYFRLREKNLYCAMSLKVRGVFVCYNTYLT